jgi:WD40 repeat protein
VGYDATDSQLQVNQIVVDDDSDLLYSCDVAGSIKKWNWRTAKDSFAQDADASQLAPVAVRPKAHSRDVNGIALNPADPSKLFSCGADDKIRVSVCADARHAPAHGCSNFVQLFVGLSAFVLPCVSSFTFAHHILSQLWDTNLSASREPSAVYNGTGTLADRFYSVAVSHDGAVVVGGTLSNAILVFQVAPPQQIASLNGHTSAVMKVRFGPRDTAAASSLFSCSKDFKIRRWNIGTQKCEMEYKGNLLYAKSGGSSAKAASLDGKRGHNNEVWDFAFTPDGNFFCAVGHKGILGADRDQTKLWDVRTGVCLYNYKGHTEDVFAVVASGKRFYTAGNDNMIKAWLAKHDDSKEHQENRKKKDYRVQMFRQTVNAAFTSACFFHFVCIRA